ncbi:major facilitator superfamily domain-containing protein [Dactylonectria estremocensis]|uniref:Major facilitator superfamily domain-containing protein n=1 Tax=Dactylonectria estremocensis TaxID=1079267 RepID=A0A9P9ENF6_9HYPO|nr:major facilitator superfamily domain-containing protein [Dactylonectria estremocensis]
MGGATDTSPQATATASFPNGTKSSNLAALPEDLELALALKNYVPDTPEERRLVRKIDMILLPCLWWMYILAYLDKGNIANANAAGLSEDLGLSDNEYSLFISVFFVGYFLCEVPSNLVMVKIRPSIYLSIIVFSWGCIVSGMSQSKSLTGFLVGRFFLGCVEAGMFPGALFILTCWYTKKEVGKRFCIFFTAGCVAPALGGLMAGAIIRSLDGTRGMSGWRWLLLIEGLITAFCATCLFFIIPDYPHNSRRFNAEERQLAHIRIMYDKNIDVTLDSNTLTSKQAFKAVIADWKTWMFLVLYNLNGTCTTISYFIPTILKTLGYTKVTAQWMTAPIYVTGAISMLIFSYTSDRSQDRHWHLTGLHLVAVAACITLLLVKNAVVKYVMMCLFIGGLYTALPLILNWASECISYPTKKRSVAIAFINSFCNLSMIYGSYLWPSSDTRHILGFTTMASFCGAAAVLAASVPVFIHFLPKTPATKAERDLLALGTNQSQSTMVST